MPKDNSRKKYFHTQQNNTVIHPAQGFLIMTDMKKESRGRSQCLQLFKNHLERESILESTGENSDDIEAQIANDIEEIKNAHKNFRPIDFDIQCVVFIATTHPRINDPSHFVSQLFSLLLSTPKTERRRSQNIQKIIPVQETCHASIDAFEQGLKNVYERYLGELIEQVRKDGEKPTIRGIFRRRMHNTLSREECLPLMVKCACEMYDGLSVDLKEPAIVIIVEVIKNVCCLCVTREYEKYFKYNIEAIYECDN